MKQAVYVILSITILFFSNCRKSSHEQTVHYSDGTTIGSGTIKSWIKTDDNGKPVSIGVTISAAAVASLPTNDTSYTVALPATSGGSASLPTPFDHIEIDWSAHGDTGTTVFDHPHLDCHFFTINTSSQMHIMGGMDSDMVEAGYVPHNCKGDESVESMMGEHWYDTTLSIYHGASFDQTCMYGFYQGSMTFIEIMCAKSYLDSNPACSGNIDQPQEFRSHGYYPMSYSINYDADTKEYSCSLDNLIYH